MIAVRYSEVKDPFQKTETIENKTFKRKKAKLNPFDFDIL